MTQINHALPVWRDPAAMFSASYDRRRRILLTRFTGCVDPDAVEEFERVLAVVAEAQGPVNAIVDLTGISALALPANFIATCSKRPPMAPDCKRVFVVQDARLGRLVQLYIDAHAIAGFHAMLLAPSVQSAIALLDVGSASFAPVDIEWLRRDVSEDAEFEAGIARPN